MIEEHTSTKSWSSLLRISKSQIQTYLICPRKFWFQYVVGQMPEFLPASLPFGSALHAGRLDLEIIDARAPVALQSEDVAKASRCDERRGIALALETAGRKVEQPEAGECGDENSHTAGSVRRRSRQESADDHMNRHESDQ